MTDANDELTDEECVRISEEFEEHEFTEDELERIFSTWRSTPWPESETAGRT